MSSKARKVHEFKPDWTIAPAATLREWLDENGMSPEVFVAACAPRGPVRGSCLARVRAVLDKEPMDEETAQILAKGTGVSVRFWLNLEHNYRAGLAAGLKDTT